MATIKEMTEKLPPKILLWGPMGTWKTSFAMTGGSAVKVLDCDRGCRVALGIKDAHYDLRTSCDIEPFYETGDDVTAYLALKKRILSLASDVKEGKMKQKVLVLDSLTVLGDYAFRFAKKTGNFKDGRLTYGLAIDEILLLMQALKYLPLATIVIGHDQKDEVDGVTVKEVSIYGKKTPGIISSYFDEVWYTKVISTTDNPPRRIAVAQTVSTSSVNVRSRNCLPDNFPLTKPLGEVLSLLNYPL